MDSAKNNSSKKLKSKEEQNFIIDKNTVKFNGDNMNDSQLTEDGIISRFTLHWKATDGYNFYVTDQNGQRFMDCKPKKSKAVLQCFLRDVNLETIGEVNMIPGNEEIPAKIEIRDVSGELRATDAQSFIKTTSDQYTPKYEVEIEEKRIPIIGKRYTKKHKIRIDFFDSNQNLCFFVTRISKEWFGVHISKELVYLTPFDVCTFSFLKLIFFWRPDPSTD